MLNLNRPGKVDQTQTGLNCTYSRGSGISVEPQIILTEIHSFYSVLPGKILGKAPIRMLPPKFFPVYHLPMILPYEDNCTLVIYTRNKEIKQRTENEEGKVQLGRLAQLYRVGRHRINTHGVGVTKGRAYITTPYSEGPLQVSTDLANKSSGN
jgi:hypothetical protein